MRANERREAAAGGPAKAGAGAFGFGRLLRAAAGALRLAATAALAAGLLAATASATNMSGSSSMLVPADVNSGGDDLGASSNYQLGVALGEAIVGPRMSSARYQAGGGLRQLLSFPNTVNDAAVFGINDNVATLRWSSPGYDGLNGRLQTGTSYFVVIATYTVPDPFTFDRYTVALATSGVQPGATVSLDLTGLREQTTYFVHLWTLDADGNLSFISNRSSFTTIDAFVLAANDLLAQPGIAKAYVSWKHAGTSSRGRPIAKFHVYRSTDAAGTFAEIGESAEPLITAKFLTPHSTYFFRVGVEDEAGNASELSEPVAVVPINVPPQEPLGLASKASSMTATLSWGQTRRWSDTSLFDSTGAPNVHELAGYLVLRSSSSCGTPFSLVATLGPNVTTYSDSTFGANFYYQVKSLNSEGASRDGVTLNSMGVVELRIPDDCETGIVLSAAEAAQVLNGATNGLGQDVAIVPEAHPEETGGAVMQAVSFRVLLDGGREIKGFHSPVALPVQLSFRVVEDIPVPRGVSSAASVSGLAKGSSARPLAASEVENLGMFWYNGIEFKKLYGKVDTVKHTVTALTPNLGKFQIRRMFRDKAGTTFDLSNITSRVFTPNGDGLNDVVLFLFDNPRSAPVTGKIYDLQGRHVADMVPGIAPDTLKWDGKANNRFVTSGVYVYQVQGEGKTFNGTVVATR